MLRKLLHPCDFCRHNWKSSSHMLPVANSVFVCARTPRNAQSEILTEKNAFARWVAEWRSGLAITSLTFKLCFWRGPLLRGTRTDGSRARESQVVF